MDKPFLLFCGSTFYPGGGWNDFVGAFASTEAAKTHLINHPDDYTHDWWHIVDASTREIIEKNAT